MPETIIVVPCFNEASRLAVEQFETFIQVHPDLRFLFVNDGSSDDTLEVLRALEARDGAHNGEGQRVFVKRIPISASWSILGVRNARSECIPNQSGRC